MNKKPAYVYEALSWASSFLKEKGREEKSVDWLMRHHLGVTDWTSFHLKRRDPLPGQVWEKFYQDVVQHGEGRPVQHLIGKEEFYGRSFMVNEHVLIPRPETEELVEGVIQEWEKRNRFNPDAFMHVIDVGTGSGIIAITLALECPGLKVTAVDRSDKALRVAKQNANELGADVHFVEGDFLTPFVDGKEKVDMIVSNPPYIPVEDWRTLDPLVKDEEPEIALVFGEDGLDAYRNIARDLPHVLKDTSFVAFEHGVGQRKDVISILKHELPEATCIGKDDINGKDRIVFCYKGEWPNEASATDQT